MLASSSPVAVSRRLTGMPAARLADRSRVRRSPLEQDSSPACSAVMAAKPRASSRRRPRPGGPLPHPTDRYGVLTILNPRLAPRRPAAAIPEASAVTSGEFAFYRKRSAIRAKSYAVVVSTVSS